MQNSKKILIIDSGMKNLGGHNFTYTRAAQSALEEKGYETDVFANKNLSDDLAREAGYKPLFTFGAYDFPPFEGLRKDLSHIYHQSDVYSSELERELKNKLSDYEAVFCHTIGDFEIIGWNKFLTRNKLNSHLMLLLRNTPNFNNLSFIKRTFHPFFRIKSRYLNSIHRKLAGRFTLLTDSELLTEDYATIFKHHILTMPIPLNKYFLDRSEESFSPSLKAFKERYGFDREKGLCLGYMGDSRESKGFNLLPGLVQQVLTESSNTYFAIQCPKSASGSDTDSLPKAAAELYAIKERFKERLLLISERLSEEDYANMFRCLDIVLVPYISTPYREATSGIFAEAVALGKPSIVTEDTWMAFELKRFGGGLEVKRNDSEDLTKKVFELIENHEHYKKKAEGFSNEWCAFHNSHKLAELLINEITLA